MKIISIRFNQNELKQLKKIIRKYKVNNVSSFIKDILFAEIKPFLLEDERFELQTAIIELNALGRNLNQLLKYRQIIKAIELLSKIKDNVEKIENIL